MAVIEKIRTKFGVAASIIIAVGLLLFIIDPSEIMSAVQNMSSKYDVGKIGSKSISYQDFQNDVEKYTRIHELVSGNTVSGEQEQMQVRNAAWQALVEKYLFSKNAKAAGVDASVIGIIKEESDGICMARHTLTCGSGCMGRIKVKIDPPYADEIYKTYK